MDPNVPPDVFSFEYYNKYIEDSNAYSKQFCLYMIEFRQDVYEDGSEIPSQSVIIGQDEN